MADVQAFDDAAFSRGDSPEVILEYFGRAVATNNIRRRIRHISKFLAVFSGIGVAIACLVVCVAKDTPAWYGIAALAVTSAMLLASLVCVLRPSLRLARALLVVAVVGFAYMASNSLHKGASIWFAVWPVAYGAIMANHLFALTRCRREYNAQMNSPATAEAVALVDRMIGRIFKAKITRDHRIVDFTQVTWIQRYYWRGMLFDDFVLFVERQSYTVAFVPRGGLGLDASRPSRFAKKRSVTLNLSPRPERVIMTDTSYQRLTTWNARLGPSPSVSAN